MMNAVESFFRDYDGEMTKQGAVHHRVEVQECSFLVLDCYLNAL